MLGQSNLRRFNQITAQFEPPFVDERSRLGRDEFGLNATVARSCKHARSNSFAVECIVLLVLLLDF